MHCTIIRHPPQIRLAQYVRSSFWHYHPALFFYHVYTYIIFNCTLKCSSPLYPTTFLSTQPIFPLYLVTIVLLNPSYTFLSTFYPVLNNMRCSTCWSCGSACSVVYIKSVISFCKTLRYSFVFYYLSRYRILLILLKNFHELDIIRLAFSTKREQKMQAVFTTE